MSKYLVRYNVSCNNEEFQKSIIYNVEDEMTEEDVINFENKMSEKSNGIVTMISFDKLYEKPKSLVEQNKEKLPNLAVFFLFDIQYNESVMAYTNIDDVVSYTFVNGIFNITLKDDKTTKQKTYVCPIPGIWIGGEDVLSKVPEGLRKQFPHTYLFSIDYENYKTK